MDFGLRCRIAPIGGAYGAYLALPAALASERVATVPRRTARGIAILPLPIDFSLTVSMAWHRRAASQPAQAWFRSQLIAAARE